MLRGTLYDNLPNVNSQFQLHGCPLIICQKEPTIHKTFYRLAGGIGPFEFECFVSFTLF